MLSEEGCCYFMLVGFWDLYEVVMLDFVLLLCNFGEVIYLGGLEDVVC